MPQDPMMRALFMLLLPALSFSVLGSACTSTVVLDPVDTSPARMAGLRARIEADSTDVQSWRDLGIIHIQREEFAGAAPLLQRAFALDPDDLYTRIYYGRALEHTGRLDEARDLYAQYQELPPSRFRRFLSGRYEATVRKLVHQDLEARLAIEDSLITIPPDVATEPNTVAVFPFAFQGGDSRYEALGRGLSTLILRDLAQLEQLTVLERIRMDVLLDELALAESEVVAPGTAPRVGLLLRARRVIGGQYTVSDDERVHLNVAMREVITEETEDLPREDRLSQFFEMEKDLVFDLIAEMDIILSAVDSVNIRFVPTQNLQAFLAYSRGMQAEEAGRYGEAAGFFRQAVDLDPGFGAAAEQIEVNEGLQAANKHPGLPPSIVREELVRDRQQKLTENTGSLILPGEDRRDEGPGGVAPIGRPPDPPAPGGN